MRSNIPDRCRFVSSSLNTRSTVRNGSMNEVGNLTFAKIKPWKTNRDFQRWGNLRKWRGWGALQYIKRYKTKNKKKQICRAQFKHRKWNSQTSTCRWGSSLCLSWSVGWRPRGWWKGFSFVGIFGIGSEGSRQCQTNGSCLMWMMERVEMLDIFLGDCCV